MDKDFNTVIPFQYDDQLFFQHEISVSQKGNQHNLINKQNQEILPYALDSIAWIVYGPVLFSINQKWGIYNKSLKKVVVEPKYDKIEWHMHFTEDFNDFVHFRLTKVKLNDKYGVIDTEGQIICPVEFDEIYFMDEDLFAVQKQDLVGLMNTQGKYVTPIKYDKLDFMGDDMLIGKYDFDKNEIISLTEQKIIHSEYRVGGMIDKQKQLINIQDTWKNGIMDKTGKIILPPKYNNMRYYSEDLAAVKLYDTWGYIDLKGNEVIPLKYEDASYFSEGLAAVKINGKWGFIRKPNNLKINTK